VASRHSTFPRSGGPDGTFHDGLLLDLLRGELLER
jgi:hypothetical protein